MEESTFNTIKDSIAAQFPEAISDAALIDDIYCINLKKDFIEPVIKFLYQNDQFRFRFLTTLCGLHYPNQKNALGLMYQLHSLENNYRLRIKSFFPANDSDVQSITGIFPSANWMEREAWDFFGIHFKNHPDLRRILNVEEMTIHPLRKEFPLEDQTRKDKNDTMFGR